MALKTKTKTTTQQQHPKTNRTQIVLNPFKEEGSEYLQVECSGSTVEQRKPGAGPGLEWEKVPVDSDL